MVVETPDAVRTGWLERVGLDECRRAARYGAQPLIQVEPDRTDRLPGDERGAGPGDRRRLRAVVAVDQEVVRGAQVKT